MKISFITLFVLFFYAGSAQSGIDFFHGDFEAAKELAKKNHKLIFMDAYAKWCGPCKRMAKDVFTDEKVGHFYNANFINLKMDMEVGEGIELLKKYRITSYPTLLFINELGEVVHMAKGSRSTDKFVELGKEALSKNDRSAEYTQRYEDGEKSPEFLMAYAYALLKSSKNPSKIVNEFLQSDPDFSKEENLTFLVDLCLESDSKIFELFLKYKKEIQRSIGNEAAVEKAVEACKATVLKSIEYNVPKLKEEAKKNMKSYDASVAKAFALEADILYYYKKSMLDEMVLTMDKYLSKFAKDNYQKHYEYARSAYNLCDQKDHLLKINKWLEHASKISKSKELVELRVRVLQKLGDQEMIDLISKDL